MKISLNWISMFTDIEGVIKNLGAKDLAHKYSIYTAEIEGIEYFGKESKVVVGKIIESFAHPDSDHLNVVKVDLGDLGITQIVCGATNVREAKYVPVATIGSVLGEGFEIKATKLRGQESNGMICSEDELGFQEERAPGIMILENIFDEKVLENQIGKPFFDLTVSIPGIDGKDFEIRLSDIVFEIDNKFITNRPDLFSILGNAREFGAIFDLKFSSYENKAVFKNDLNTKILTDKVLSYHLYKVSNVNAEVSPFAVSYLLHKSGLPSKFDLVDMTNYIMTELGQPMHAFDADKIEGDICVRQAFDGEKIEALNGETYELKISDIVIADDKKVLAIAGIMGGAYSAISESTKDIYIESACFDPSSVRLTAQRLGLRSDSSTRYEKSLDPLLAEIALNRAEDFLKYLKKDYKIKGSSFYLNAEKIKDISIPLTREFVEKKIGIEIDEKEFDRILGALGFSFEKRGDEYSVSVPSWRATKDVSIKEDLAEEIGRINGYEKVPELPVSGNISIKNRNEIIELKDKINDYFTGKGFLEAYNYSFLNEAKDEKIGIIDHTNAIKILNAFSNEFTIMRRKMLPYLIENVSNNAKAENSFSFYEIAKVMEKIDGKFNEKLMVAGIAYKVEFEYLRSVLDGFMSSILPEIKYKTVQKTDILNFPYFHPNKSGSFELESGENLINFGYVNPIVASNFDLDDSDLIYFEMDFNLLFQKYLSSSFCFSEISRFPGINRELNFVMEEKTPVGDVIGNIGDVDLLIRNVTVLDIYRNIEKIGTDMKSVTFNILIQDFTKTITDDIALDIQNKIIARLKKYGVELRGV
ncbi:MAG: phenylalanine--tRNA ligase subunit beta [Candidatus Gracilibacteria bacterium]|nr:phenylalanine--tRNA ligase subunit beta [Candidatus Gracilibacteria bacterium]